MTERTIAVRTPTNVTRPSASSGPPMAPRLSIIRAKLSTPAYFCARIILTAHFSYSFQQLTISKVLSYLFCSSRRSMQPPHPTAGRLHLDPLWWTAGAETSAREIDRRASSSALVSSAKPTTGIQVVRPAAPHGLDSLTPDARRAGPLHPRPHRFASCPSKASLAPG